MKKSKLVRAGLSRELPSQLDTQRIPAALGSHAFARALSTHSREYRLFRKVVTEPRGLASIRVWQHHRARPAAFGKWAKRCFPDHNMQNRTKLFAFGDGSRPGPNADAALSGFAVNTMPNQVLLCRHMFI